MFQFHEFFNITFFSDIFANSSVETRTSSRPRRWQTYGFKNEEEEAGERACVDVDEETVPELADERRIMEQRYVDR